MINLRHDERSASETDASFFSQPDVAAHLYPILPDPDGCSPNRTVQNFFGGQTPRSPIALPHNPWFYARLK
jgi:hypothetical protein